MKMELQILEWIQQMRTPVGDVWMVFISRLGNAGMIWILFTCLLLMIPRTRRWGAALAVALCLDAIICNILLKPMVCRMSRREGIVRRAGNDQLNCLTHIARTDPANHRR